jgi:hypothetical protein
MDCSKTINFFAEAKRLCDSRTACEADAANKEQCPLRGFCGFPFSAICAKKAIEVLQKWSTEHPKKTYAQDFLEKFPEAQRTWDGVPFVCRKRIYGGIHSAKSEGCEDTKACYRCWNKPMEE